MRNRSLDVLRTIAVLAVLLFHFTTLPIATSGWMGVDLFFVLSGYLVSGLLFDELARKGSVRPVRFLLRRAFKIYPAFWIMIGLTVVFSPVVRPLAVACELLFLQNYGPGLWVHTWSLAVEEHFYLLVAAGFALHARRPASWTVRGKLLAFAGALLAVLASRIVTVIVVPARYKLVEFGTHVRIDALLCGVGVAWVLREATLAPQVRAFVVRQRITLAAIAIAALVPIGLADHNGMFVRTIGFTIVYLACAALLLVALSLELRGPIWAGGSVGWTVVVLDLPVALAGASRAGSLHGRRVALSTRLGSTGRVAGCRRGERVRHREALSHASRASS